MEKPNIFWPRARTQTDKNKDIMIAKLQHQLYLHEQQSKYTKKVFLFVLIHILILSLCLSFAILYHHSLTQRTKKPQNCLFYTIDLKYDFASFCQVCESGFQRPEGQFGCVPQSSG